MAWVRASLPLLALAVAAAGCDFIPGDDPPGFGSTGSGGGIGDGCEDETRCRMGLSCVEDAGASTCQLTGETAEGESCVLSGECAEGLYCPAEVCDGDDCVRVCAPGGTTESGGNCATTADCMPGLRCVFGDDGFFARCQETGTGDIRDSCIEDLDCYAGLFCLSGQCSNAPAGSGVATDAPRTRIWSGAGNCPAGEATEAPTAYFQVPRTAGSTGDFLRMPYPNDMRRSAEGLDLSGHPSPTDAFPNQRLIDDYLEAASEDLDGFGRNPVAYFRFSRPAAADSFNGNSVRIIDVDASGPSFGQEVARAWLVTTGPAQLTRYLCPNWVGVRSQHGRPLAPGRSYAVLLTREVRGTEGESFQPDADFTATLGATRPGDPELALAWDAHAPLRAYLASEDPVVSAAELLVGTVLTTQSERDHGRLREVIRAQDAPALSDLAACADGVAHPCDDGTEARACVAESAEFTELRGRIELPIFQQGTAPYLEAGGAIAYDAGGAPTVARTESVCFALTVPNATAPAAGWPLIVAAHGTGGSFRTAARNGLAADAATASVEGAPVPTATLAIDLPQHGARRGTGEGSDEDEDVLFFNFANPRAARDNVIQGAADLFSLVHWAVNGPGIEAASSPTGEDIRFDASAIALFAHSQGATHADLMAPYEPDLAAVVFSGNAGDLTLQLLQKRAPLDIAALVPFALQDADGAGQLPSGDYHPALALLQMFFDAADPVNYAGRLTSSRPGGVPARNVFMTFGIGDTFTVDDAQLAYALAAGLPHVPPFARTLAGLDETATVPFSANLEGFTVGLRSYEPLEGDDGHFVAFRTDAGVANSRAFLFEAVAGSAPTLR
ncbi:MAG: hypothetical protein AAF447_19855 [Myxococcota bacterium]